MFGNGVTGDVCYKGERTGGWIAKGGTSMGYIGGAGGNTGFGCQRCATTLGSGRYIRMRCGGFSAGVPILGAAP